MSIELASNLVNGYLFTGGSSVATLTFGAVAWVTEELMSWGGSRLGVAHFLGHRVFALGEYINQEFDRCLGEEGFWRSVVGSIFDSGLMSSGFVLLSFEATAATSFVSSLLSRSVVYGVYGFGLRCWGQALDDSFRHFDDRWSEKAVPWIQRAAVKTARMAAQVGLFYLTGNLIVSMSIGYAGATFLHGLFGQIVAE